MGQLRVVNGTRIFVDERGAADAPVLLFIHGGPGNPCWDFMESVGALLARRLRVIGVDQRGVLRSDALPDGVTPSVAGLIADFEALRGQLGITRWTILGHSAGGAYALDYALAHPDAVDGVIFDCPCFDADSTDRYRLPRAAELADSLGQTGTAEAMRALAAKTTRITGADESWKLLAGLGEDHLRVFFHDQVGIDAYHRVMSRAEDLGFDWSRSMSHLPLLDDMYTNRLPRLADLAVPSMLIHGTDDLVAPPTVIEAYAEATGGTVRTIEASGHFAFIEQPEQYAAAVTDFVTGSVRR